VRNNLATGVVIAGFGLVLLLFLRPLRDMPAS
jgi:hypothetical protein